VIKKNKEGYFGFEKVSVVCTLTGNGLKDPDNAIKCAVEPVTVENDMQVILQAIGI
jgi:threonine synthase